MMKKLITLAFIFLAAWGAGYIWSKYHYTVSDGSMTIKKLIDCDAEKIQSVQFTRKKVGAAPELLAFEHVPALDSAWKITNPNLGEADAVMMDHIVSLFCESFNPEAANADAKNLQLEKESTGVLLTQKDGKTFSFTIPSEMNGRDALFLSNKKVFKILPVLKQAVNLPAEKYQNHRVMNMSGDNIISLCVYDGSMERYCFSREGSDWSVAQKEKVLGTGTEEVNKYANRVSTLLALHILDAQKSWPDCQKQIQAGKNIRMEVTGVAGRKESLLFSAPLAVASEKRENFLLACNSTRGSLFAVHTDLLKFLNVSFAQLVQKKSAAP